MNKVIYNTYCIETKLNYIYLNGLNKTNIQKNTKPKSQRKIANMQPNKQIKYL